MCKKIHRGGNAERYHADKKYKEAVAEAVEACAAANNYGITLIDLRRFEEAKRLLRKVLPVARRVLGAEHVRTLSLREDLARATLGGDSSSKEKRKALQTLE
jgi:hypothetical protein